MTDDGEQDDYENVDEVVGLIVSGSVIPADEVADGSVFGGYSHPGRYDDLEWRQIRKSLEEYGYKLEQYFQKGTDEQ